MATIEAVGFLIFIAGFIIGALLTHYIIERVLHENN